MADPVFTWGELDSTQFTDNLNAAFAESWLCKLSQKYQLNFACGYMHTKIFISSGRPQSIIEQTAPYVIRVEIQQQQQKLVVPDGLIFG